MFRKHIFFIFFLLASVSCRAQFNIDRLVRSGRIALQYEDYVLSIQYFNQAISGKPYLYEPWFYRALAKYNLGDYVGAEEDCSRAIAINPYIDGMYDLRAVCRIRQQKYQDAIGDYGNAIRLNPTSRDYWYNRAYCRVQINDYAVAHSDLDSVITRWSKFTEAYSLQAEIYLHENDTARATRWLDRTVEINPYDAQAWVIKGRIYMARGNWKMADQSLGKAIHLKPKTVNNYVDRAVARVNLKNYRGAMSDYDMAIDLDPNNFLAHYNRALLRMQVGDDNRAISDFNFVLKLEPNNLQALYNRATLLDRTGNLQGAIRDYSTVIAEFPNFWTGLQNRASCYRRLGMTAKAEMDEFRIMKAQMNKHLGVQPRWSKNKLRKVRRQSDVDVNKYDQMVIADDNVVVEHEYKSKYRGLVQNQKADDDFLPLYVLSYYKYDNGVNEYQAFDSDVESYNSKNKPLKTIYVACNTQRSQLDEQQSKASLDFVGALSAKIADTHDVGKRVALLFQRAVAYTTVQNYEEAMADLNAVIATDSTMSMAFWQRAVCLSVLATLDHANAYDAQLQWARTMDDLDTAIKLAPHNVYLYYDKGVIHSFRKEYAQAIDCYTQAIKQDSKLAEAYYNRGLARIYINQKQAGLADLSKAGELGLFKAYSAMKRFGGK